ncbi:vWA domain-containing protein [Ruegeria arenilitoris]|uniref:vWA domain-containing protein n=1 Tax=Ruegeria arenilitoris TaxID=1173585 RepID=UPI00148006F3|nr:VWA domain-containing protein [Ruegeria arenilitoris]
MSDELDDLKTLMDAATPAPDEKRRAVNLELARKNFADLQGSRPGTRPNVRRGQFARVTEGTKAMLNAISTRGALAATTAIAAIALIMIVPQTRDGVLSPSFDTETRVIGQPQAVRPSGQSDAETAEMVLEEPVVEAPMVVEEAREPLAKRSLLSQGRLVDSTVAPSVSSDAFRPPARPEQSSEEFANAETNSRKVTAEEPVSTFSIDVDTASYAIVRSSLLAGHLPPRDAVRIEEMVNYFPYSYPAPDGAVPFQPSITVMPSPWNTGTRLVHIGIQGTLPVIEERPALNLVFLIDTSGSMQDANKLPLLKQSLRLMLPELRPEDQVSIVTYAGSAGQVLEPTSAADQAKILRALEQLDAGGSTAGQAGLQQAYQVAEEMAAEGELTRVILATDGDFNVGLSDPEALKEFISDKRDSGTYLSVLGFGRGNLDDATMQALAQNGNGQAAYIDTLGEARKVLVDQLTGALFPIANDVKIQVEFNPAQIAEYRLIGYETRALRREDFLNDTVDAGDIGAGHSVTAIYEVTPVGSNAIRNAPLRYGNTAPASGSDEIGYFKLRYKTPGDTRSQLIEQPILDGQGRQTDDVRFSVAIAGFGQLLRGGTYLSDWSYDDAIAMGNTARGSDPFGYRAEAVTLMRLAQSLSK